MSGSNDTPRYRNLQIGERFTRLVVIGPHEERIVGVRSKNRRFFYPCRCDCGRIKSIESTQLIGNGTKSCGCLRDEHNRTGSIKHGQSKTALYNVWNAIISRCENPNSGSYHRYGDRGITMCREWREDYIEFHDWAMANGYKAGLTVERKNNDLGYSPENCVLATRTTQARNRRSSCILTAWGETKTAVEWTEDPRCNASQGLIHYRIKNGVDHQTAISAPPNSGRKFHKAST